MLRDVGVPRKLQMSHMAYSSNVAIQLLFLKLRIEMLYRFFFLLQRRHLKGTTALKEGFGQSSQYNLSTWTNTYKWTQHWELKRLFFHLRGSKTVISSFYTVHKHRDNFLGSEIKQEWGRNILHMYLVLLKKRDMNR